MTNGNHPINAIPTLTDKDIEGMGKISLLSGLTKREYFAAMAMQGSATKAMDYNDLINMANDAVFVADCLINALNKESEVKS